jgi:hypothetical protein
VGPLGGCLRSRSAPFITMMRAVPLLLCIFSARVAAQTPGHLRGTNLATETTTFTCYPNKATVTCGGAGKCFFDPTCGKEAPGQCKTGCGAGGAAPQCRYCDCFGKDLCANFHSNPCESLSETDPAPCPMTYGASGAAINAAKMCVYSQACVASGGLDCFEQTGCKYSDGFGIDLSANLSSNTATASASTLAYPSPTQCGEPGEPKTCSADSNCQTSVAWPFPGSDWVGPCSKCDRGYGCAVVHDCEGSGVDCIGPCACEGI